MERPYILLDRDGTVIAEKHYLSDPAQVELLPGAADGLRLLQEAGYGLVLITNQSGIGRGMFTQQDLERVHARLEELLAAEGVHLDGIYSCPHAPEEDCDCRKPRTKLVRDAARDFGFNLTETWVVGDKLADIDLARNAGARSILVRTGYGQDAEAKGAKADVVVDGLREAAVVIRKTTGVPNR
jgi:D-glycero-D-manno-heptose 1,7-bisphosphate phosphatase